MPTVVQIDAWDPVAGGVVALCSASHDHPEICHLGGGTWWPAIAKLPTLRYDLFDGAFAGQIVAPSSTISLQTEPWPSFGRYILADARIRIWHGSFGDNAANYALRFDGRVTSQPKLQDGRADIDFAVDDRWLDTALLTLYAGTTGAEGPAALKGQAKPLALGAPRYVPGKLVDAVNSVFQVSSYGAIKQFQAALERLVRFPAPIGDYPDYASLVAAQIPAGQWATATAVGMARFGAPPTGQISFVLCGDAAGDDGWVHLPGRVIRRLALLSGGAGRIDEASLAALDVARPYDVSIYVDAQTNARELIQKLAASVNAVAGMSWTGQLFVAPVAVGATTIVLAADGTSLPAIASVQQIDAASPYRKLAIGAERAWTVHELGDIAFTAAVVDLGLYAGATSYREGNVVNLADGSRWLYIATAPASGSAPDVNNAVWSRLTGPTAAVYGDGTSIEVLKPAQAGADKTSVNTARYLYGQGSLATLSSVAYGSPYVTGFGGLAPLSSLALGGSYLFAADGATRLTDANTITAYGTARYLYGMGSLALKSQADFFADLAQLPLLFTDPAQYGGGISIRVKADYLLYSNGVSAQAFAPQEAGANVTEIRTARYIFGQSPFATSTEYGFLTGRPAFLANLYGNGYARAAYIQDGSQTKDMEAYFPATTGADQTSNGTARYIFGQSPFATSTEYGFLTGRPAFLANLYGNGYARAAYIQDGSQTKDMEAYFPATTGADQTSNGTARYIFGQSPFATSTEYGFLTGRPAFLANLYGNGYACAAYIQNGAQTKDMEAYFPATPGADQTSNGTARFFYGQGGLSLKDRASDADLNFGATGQSSIYANENQQTFSSTSAWTTIAAVTLTPAQGQPIEGNFSTILTDVTSGGKSTQVLVRVRRDDGTIVKFPGGRQVAARDEGESCAFTFLDSVAAGRQTTWYVEMIKKSGTTDTVGADGTFLRVNEISRNTYQNITIITPDGTGAGAGGGGGGNVNGGGSGIGCAEIGEPLLMANAKRTGPGGTIPIGDVRAGMCVWTRHERTGAWGAYPVTYVCIKNSPVWSAPGRPLASPSHQFINEDLGITLMEEIGTYAREGMVVALHVEEARTYVVGGAWSHNKQASG